MMGLTVSAAIGHHRTGKVHSARLDLRFLAKDIDLGWIWRIGSWYRVVDMYWGKIPGDDRNLGCLPIMHP
jgi:hypothetical protein